MLELHGFLMSPNTRRALFALEEHGAAYELVTVDLMTGAHKKPEHLAHQPFGQVPALDDLVVSTIDLGSAFEQIHVDGILGYPFFASAEVELNAAAHTMRFGPPGSFVPEGERIALDVDREIPEATFRINDRVFAKAYWWRCGAPAIRRVARLCLRC